MNRSSHLFLLRELVRRDFTQRYAGSLLGLAWSFIQPLWQLLLLSFVFSIIIRLSLESEPTNRFWVFLFCGLLPWTAVHEGIQRSSTAITDHAEMVKKIRFPSEILIAAVVVTALIHEAITMSFFLLALILVGELVWQNLPLLLFALVLQVFLTLGLGFLTAGVHVFFRDTAQFLGLALNAWFYLTPIVFPIMIVPERYRGWIQANPLSALVTMYRRALLGGGSLWVEGTVSLIICTVLAFVGGLWLFRRLKPGFSDEI